MAETAAFRAEVEPQVVEGLDPTHRTTHHLNFLSGGAGARLEAACSRLTAALSARLILFSGGVEGLMSEPLVGVIMGSRSDWACMKEASDALDALGVPYEVRVVSAHRTPDLLFRYAEEAEGRGIEVIIAGAGGAAHLPGMVASKTVLPVLGVPVKSRSLNGLDSLLSIVQMPGGVPVGTLAIGEAGALNAALLAASILGAKHPEVRERLRSYRAERTEAVLADPDPSVEPE